MRCCSYCHAWFAYKKNQSLRCELPKVYSDYQGGLLLRYSLAMGILLCAAFLEAGGDALMRMGLRSPTHTRAALFFVLGGLVLTFYGYAVNAPPWDFGRLLGVYVAFFFVVAQAMSWLGFGQKPTPMILLGGSLIVIGGCVVSLAK
jgi:small multidrug resistance family-3 protein